VEAAADGLIFEDLFELRVRHSVAHAGGLARAARATSIGVDRELPEIDVAAMRCSPSPRAAPPGFFLDLLTFLWVKGV